MFPTALHGLDKDKIQEETKLMLRKIGELQYKMYAEKKSSLLIILQGMDASGKDGLVDDLLRYCNPVGVSVHGFKKPTEEEFAHDFLWRVHQHTPGRGITQIFIRSHYEDILVPSVEGYFTPEIIENRYSLVNDFERLVQHNGTRILKFFLSISFEEQEERLKERLENPEKYWKHNDGDWDTRQKFDQYLEAYNRIISRCNVVPWVVVPSDKNWQKLYVVANEVERVLDELDPQFPPLKTEKFRK